MSSRLGFVLVPSVILVGVAGSLDMCKKAGRRGVLLLPLSCAASGLDLAPKSLAAQVLALSCAESIALGNGSVKENVIVK